MESLRVGCLLMAAGSGSRFGGCKLQAELDGKTLLERALETIPDGVFAKTVVVTSPELAGYVEGYPAEVCINDRPEEGLSRTVRLGTERLMDCDGILYLVSDQPLLVPSTVGRIVSAWRQEPERIAAACHGGRRGNPCLFPKKLYGELCNLTGDTGGSAVIKAHEELLLPVETDERELTDVDTPEMLRVLKRKKIKVLLDFFQKIAVSKGRAFGRAAQGAKPLVVPSAIRRWRNPRPQAMALAAAPVGWTAGVIC